MIRITIIAAVLPALVLVYFIYTKDKFEKEPSRELIKGFGFGALSAMAALLVSIPLQLIGLYSVEDATVFGQIRTAVFGAGIPEELIKFFFLWLLLKKNRSFNEYVDGIVYAVCIGMGFAALENILYLFRFYENWVILGAWRAVLSVPVHFFLAVTMGYFYAKARFDPSSNRKRNIILAILLPILSHSVYDAILMVSTAAGITTSAFFLIVGLYVYLAVKSKKRFEKHLATDEQLRNEAGNDGISA